ncbi:MAG: hypothetical protein ACYDCQ_00270 [Dehalococcoidia bacterium]
MVRHEFDWDEANFEKIAWEHDVAADEVEEALDDRHGYGLPAYNVGGERAGLGLEPPQRNGCCTSSLLGAVAESGRYLHVMPVPVNSAGIEDRRDENP